jgi:hypothetical protein
MTHTDDTDQDPTEDIWQDWIDLGGEGLTHRGRGPARRAGI